MGKKKGFTLIELLVVIAIIALLMSILMPALTRVKKQARKVVCQAQMKQWGLFWKLYCDDNEGNWLSGGYNSAPAGANLGNGNWCFLPIFDSYAELEDKMLCCPQATKPSAYGKIGSWAYTAWQNPEGVTGSYGPNGWMCNLNSGSSGVWGRTSLGRDAYWKSVTMKGGYNVPLWQGQWWVDAWPTDRDAPPDITDSTMAIPDTPNTNEMWRVCVDRHDGTVMNLFCDWSARPVGMKELWTLKWNRIFDTRNAWTRSGGVNPSDWPQWMRGMKDY